MYLYIGNDIVINSKDVVGIFDTDNTTISKNTRKFLNLSEKNGQIINVSYELPKSFIVCREKKSKKKKVYLCQLSPSTLQKRKGIGY
ncbi:MULTISPECIES: extracellular matrix regulator RemB [unclassified Ruminococcus]|uniref:extracellular matrix regulator RemB n=1 Tax=unclassified Ruminococcus TaxID=2608920 RepID=UPI00210B22E5|nr:MULTISPECIES: extracellular matrix/biofilm biosynthesis regulator RemA family protein [unclassified Ruminococcus]MCQ4021965.1 DUF370 domain-containing protein [Ruminococcus sp. zg-924]MCQ4114501.1 DUF370 domain-containing protein [Ruminococcus sp. zg-921]